MEEFEITEYNRRFSISEKGFRRAYRFMYLFDFNAKTIPWEQIISVSNKRWLWLGGNFVLTHNDGVKETKLKHQYLWGLRPYFQKLADLIAERIGQTG